MNKQPTILFTHCYSKLLVNSKPARTAKLLLVLPASNEEINRADFIAYDTDNGLYTLSYAEYYVVLLFQKPNGELFTTVRPRHGRYGNKEVYYKALIGKEFNIIINA